MSISGYLGGDPRLFHPDPELCTPEEMKNHDEACAAWKRGERPEPQVQINGVHNGVPFHASVRPFGLGYQEEPGDPEEDAECVEPVLNLDELSDEELYGLYLSGAGKDSDDAMKILAERHSAELFYDDDPTDEPEDPHAPKEDEAEELAEDH